MINTYKNSFDLIVKQNGINRKFEDMFGMY